MLYRNNVSHMFIEKEGVEISSLFFCKKIRISGKSVVNLFNQKHKTMPILTEDQLFNRFLDDDYQAKQFKIQEKTPYRERKPKQENIIDMVSLANKIFLK